MQRRRLPRAVGVDGHDGGGRGGGGGQLDGGGGGQLDAFGWRREDRRCTQDASFCRRDGEVAPTGGKGGVERDRLDLLERTRRLSRAGVSTGEQRHRRAAVEQQVPPDTALGAQRGAARQELPVARPGDETAPATQAVEHGVCGPVGELAAQPRQPFGHREQASGVEQPAIQGGLHAVCGQAGDERALRQRPPELVGMAQVGTTGRARRLEAVQRRGVQCEHRLQHCGPVGLRAPDQPGEWRGGDGDAVPVAQLERSQPELDRANQRLGAQQLAAQRARRVGDRGGQLGDLPPDCQRGDGGTWAVGVAGGWLQSAVADRHLVDGNTSRGRPAIAAGAPSAHASATEGRSGREMLLVSVGSDEPPIPSAPRRRAARHAICGVCAAAPTPRRLDRRRSRPSQPCCHTRT